jgi:coenzyme F420-reducing hydrogenase delta subunit/Pyruvate/2-oxoacid:ferredoxin oxidoreductase delta subunit
MGNTQVYFLGGNMKVGEEGVERLYTGTREAGVLFFKFTHEGPEIQTLEKEVRFTFKDEILGQTVSLNAQVMVVDEELLPHPDLGPLALTLDVPLDARGFLAPDQVYALPVRTTRKGILAVGGSRRPVEEGSEVYAEVQEAVLSAGELLGQGRQMCEVQAVEVDRKKCTICLTCVRSCPHRAMIFEFRRPQPSPLACQRCGICAAECPMDAIQIKAIPDAAVLGEISANFEGRRYDTVAPEVVVFCCRNSAWKTLEQAIQYQEALPVGFAFIRIPCAGKLDPDYVLHAFQEGADGVVVLACPIEGCKSFEGNLRARERVLFLKDTVKDLGLEPGRIFFHTPGPGMVAQLLGTLMEVEDQVRRLGISPVRRAKGIKRIYDKFTLGMDNKLFVLAS